MIERVREIIKLKAKSAREFAELIGVKQVTFNQQLTGDRKLSLDTITSILDSFEYISAEWLLRGKGEMLTTEKTEASANAQSLIPDHQDYISEIERLKTLVARLEGQNDLLREQLGLPERVKVKSVS